MQPPGYIVHAICLFKICIITAPKYLPATKQMYIRQISCAATRLMWIKVITNKSVSHNIHTSTVNLHYANL